MDDIVRQQQRESQIKVPGAALAKTGENIAGNLDEPTGDM